VRRAPRCVQTPSRPYREPVPFSRAETPPAAPLFFTLSLSLRLAFDHTLSPRELCATIGQIEERHEPTPGRRSCPSASAEEAVAGEYLRPAREEELLQARGRPSPASVRWWRPRTAEHARGRGFHPRRRARIGGGRAPQLASRSGCSRRAGGGGFRLHRQQARIVEAPCRRACFRGRLQPMSSRRMLAVAVKHVSGRPSTSNLLGELRRAGSVEAAVDERKEEASRPRRSLPTNPASRAEP
jgi:hypothetical protein